MTFTSYPKNMGIEVFSRAGRVFKLGVCVADCKSYDKGSIFQKSNSGLNLINSLFPEKFQLPNHSFSAFHIYSPTIMESTLAFHLRAFHIFGKQ